jgi:DNA-binding beta-propeller fold protein YncE
MNLGLLSKCVLITAISAVPVLAADVIATGLNNPRGIALAPDGDLYVAEAGTGGNGPCIPSSDGTTPCFGTTGSITRVHLRTGGQERIATGFPSLAGPTGGGAIGPAGISFQGQGNGYIAVGLGSNPAFRSQLGPVGADMAHEARMQPNGKWSPQADLGTFEMTNNPAGGPVDTDPFGILALPGKQIVADAGGNDLLEIAANGRIQTLAVFPDQFVPAPPFLGLPPGTNIPAEPVPTTVVLGPDGAYYVGQLTGFPFQPGSANIYRVSPQGGIPTVAYSGFTNIISIAFGPDGSLYVLEISKNGLLSGNPAGALIKVLPNGTRTELAAGQLSMPGGLVLSSDGTLYVTNWSVLAGGGQVLRIQQ